MTMNSSTPIAAVVMAGGRGERFWPASRIHCPKQFLSLTGDGETMLQKTVRRLDGLVPTDRVYIVTNEEYLGLVREQLPDVPEQNLLCEPAPRNTAPAIALAAAVIRKRLGDAVMLVLPSDHLVRHEALCADVLSRAAAAAETGENLLTVGITPAYPETGYGYIEFTRAEGMPVGVYSVSSFREKPDAETAQQYVASGRYLWNSGMFAWKVSTYFSALQTHLPAVHALAEQLGEACDTPAFSEALEKVFPQMPSVSVDYGVLEHAQQLFTIPGSFGWDDVGSWPALRRVAKTDTNGNYRSGDTVTIGTRDCVLVGGKKLMAAVGLEHIIAVDTEDALLICDADSAQNVKKITEMLREQGRGELL